MTQSILPARYDHVGSFLRPEYLLQARAQKAKGEISAEQLRAVEDKAITEIVRFQESVGLKAITDGEFRRTYFHIDFLDQLGGVKTDIPVTIKKPDGSAVPGIIIPFSTTIESGKNFFGLELCGGDHVYSPSSYATVISNAGIVFPGYVGMDASIGGAAIDSTNNTLVLCATPYVYLIPCGNDCMRAPALGDTDIFRTWKVQDQALVLRDRHQPPAFRRPHQWRDQDWQARHPALIVR